MTDKPYNNFFQYVFSIQPIVQDLLVNFVTDVANELDLNSLKLDNTTYIDEKLTEFYSDIVYEAFTKDEKRVKITLLFEHKSSPPQFPHLQILDYMQGIWRRDLATPKAKTSIRKKRGKRKSLTLVVPIIFYHGKEKWKNLAFSAFFDNVDVVFKPFIPRINYHLIDLENYDDEFILKLKAGFLINSLIAFKHKNETEYVKKHFARIFVNLDRHDLDEATKNFFKRLIVFIVITTKIKNTEVRDLIDILPKETRDKVNIVASNAVEEWQLLGLEEGLEKGSKITATIKTLEVAQRLLKTSMSDAFIIEISEIDIHTLAILRANFENKYQNKPLQIKLAKHLISHFDYLSNENIVQFSQLALNEVEKMR